jgi:aspartate carbamoyltransferase catalytic subunit
VILLAMFEHMKFVYISPPGLELPDYIIEEINRVNDTVQQVHGMTLDEAIELTDVLYVTRIQKERFSNEVNHCMKLNIDKAIC